ncbi:hypothetical protein NFI96_020837 [Prochilodus magdalenae]|nr:hypothetical protein NFI96_020837 [Prochilodus magdalenae]
MEAPLPRPSHHSLKHPRNSALFPLFLRATFLQHTLLIPLCQVQCTLSMVKTWILFTINK